MENYYKEIETRLITSGILTNTYAKDNDVNRNHVNYGCCTCWVQVLRDMGHYVEFPVYEENGLLKIPFISIDNEKIYDFKSRK